MEDCEAHLECSGLEPCYLTTNELYFYVTTALNLVT
jgi:hypothetical protein